MKMLKKLGLSIIATGMLFASPNNESYSLSRVINSDNSLIMDNHYLRIGVSDDGTFGVGGTKKPGFELDPTGEGNYTFVKPDGSVVIPDYLTPGTPFEGFSIKFVNDDNETIYKINENDAYTQIKDSNISKVSMAPDGNLTGVLHTAIVKDGDTNYLEIKQLYTITPGSTTLNIKVYLTNLTDKPLYDVRYARFLDPDPDVEAFGTYDTQNQLGLILKTTDGNITIAPQNIAYALGKKSNMPVGIFTFDDKYTHNAVISPSWTKDPDKILKGGCDGDGDLNASRCTYGDYTIGLAFKIDKILPHKTVVLDLGYLFGTSIKKAVESTTSSVKLDKTFLDSLSTGWHLIGTDKAVLDMSIFNDVSIVWVYEDGNWKWYSADPTLASAIKSAGDFEKITKIKPLSGIWVYKKDVTLPSVTEEHYEDTNSTEHYEDTNSTK
jgi:hypothetical protein